ncbi:SDR family NAD(P)-dependent oxidoreductase [Sphingopyxis terrae]|uniref:SDR family NAD(P)-dependent oxidoreductase n=1 Tax=Sphingopyxis terrae TaxID=33052 RepID=UPI00360FD6D1
MPAATQRAPRRQWRASRDDVPGADLSFVRLDLADLDQVREAAAAVRAGPRIDVLVNNAGVMIPPRSLTAQGFELQFGVNHLGTFAFTGLIHGHVDDRIVVTASLAHKSGTIDFSDLDARRGYHGWSRYQASKLANLSYMFELDRRLARGAGDAGDRRASGVALTELTRHLPWPLRSMTPLATPFFNSAAQGAWPTLQAATGAHVQGGDYLGPQGLGEISGASGPARATKAARDPKLGANCGSVRSTSPGSIREFEPEWHLVGRQIEKNSPLSPDGHTTSG